MNDHRIEGEDVGLFGKLKSALERSPKPNLVQENSAEAKFAKALNSAIIVLSDLGAELQVPHPEDGIGVLFDGKHLPHSRETIMWAIAWMQMVLANDATRAEAIRVLTPELAQSIFSEKYANSLAALRVLLDDYVPEEKLAEQRALKGMADVCLRGIKGRTLNP
jgi:hypothetical protein